MKYSVIVTPDAEKDLRTIYRYIRKHAPLAAGTWVKGARTPINPLPPCPDAPINHKPHLLMWPTFAIEKFMESAAQTAFFTPCLMAVSS